MVTISTHNGTSVAREHNIRNKKVVSKEPHIAPDGIYEIWIDEPVRQAYERLFGESVRKYNEKQTRQERKIKSYYNNICNDKKKHPVYEMIIGIYGKSEDGSSICSSEQGKEIMHKFVSEWQERNPNLELIGAYYHADEEGEPHVHLDYVPVAHGYQKGMEIQNGLVKALGEMGFEKQGKATAQIQWEKRENDYLTSLCESVGLTVSHPKSKKEHLETQVYKLTKHIEELNQEIESLKGQILTQNQVFDIEGKKTLFGGLKNVTYKQYLDLRNTAIKVGEVERVQEDVECKLRLLASKEERFDKKQNKELERTQEKIQEMLENTEKECTELKTETNIYCKTMIKQAEEKIKMLNSDKSTVKYKIIKNMAKAAPTKYEYVVWQTTALGEKVIYSGTKQACEKYLHDLIYKPYKNSYEIYKLQNSSPTRKLDINDYERVSKGVVMINNDDIGASLEKIYREHNLSEDDVIMLENTAYAVISTGCRMINNFDYTQKLNTLLEREKAEKIEKVAKEQSKTTSRFNVADLHSEKYAPRSNKSSEEQYQQKKRGAR